MASRKYKNYLNPKKDTMIRKDNPSVESAFYRDMENFKLLSAEEEQGCSKNIHDNFQAMINEVMINSLSNDLGKIQEMIKNWMAQDNSLKPQQCRVRSIMSEVFIASRLNSENIELRKLYNCLKIHQREVEMARDIIVQSNLRLVVSIAWSYRNRGLPIDDLVQEGNVGLMRAAMRFDYRVGTRFVTYASWWIRQAISNALVQKTKTIQIPFHVRKLQKEVNSAKAALLDELGHEPTLEEIACKSNLSSSQVKMVAVIPGEPISLDKPLSDDGLTVGHTLQDVGAPLFDKVVATENRQLIGKCMQKLNQRERDVILMRFGLDRCGEKTLKEIGKMMKISRERVRQLETQALTRLGFSSCVAKVAGHCN
jgi:RNA polymerase primary sigma factor